MYFGAEGDVYVVDNFDCDGNWVVDVDCAEVVDSVADDCGVCRETYFLSRINSRHFI